MPFATDDQRKAAFARMRGNGRGGGGPRPPRGGPGTGGIVTVVGPIWNPILQPSPPVYAPTEHGTTTGSEIHMGGIDLPNLADYQFQAPGGIASLEDWEDAIRWATQAIWEYNATGQFFQDSIFDPDYWKDYQFQQYPEFYYPHEFTMPDGSPTPQYSNFLGGGETFASELRRWIYDMTHGNPR